MVPEKGAASANTPFAQHKGKHPHPQVHMCIDQAEGLLIRWPPPNLLHPGLQTPPSRLVQSGVSA